MERGMRDDLQRLLELQAWDLETIRLEGELNSSAPVREEIVQKVLDGRKKTAALKEKYQQVCITRKDTEAKIEELQAQIAKYSAQQLQTKKNDEYRAFENQIAAARKNISTLETKVLELMDAEELARKTYEDSSKSDKESEKTYKERILSIDKLKVAHTQEIKERKQKRKELEAKVEPALRIRYERMFRNKRGHVLVGIDGGACGGCHIKLPQQAVLSCISEEPNVTCINCGRMLYYSPEMHVEN